MVRGTVNVNGYYVKVVGAPKKKQNNKTINRYWEGSIKIINSDFIFAYYKVRFMYGAAHLVKSIALPCRVEQ